MNWLFRSAPQKPVPRSVLLTCIAVLWGAPCVLGWMVAGLTMSAKTVIPAEAQLYLYGLVYLLIFSPVFSWVGWVIAAPVIWFLLRDGWFGWGSAALVGIVIGAVAGGLVGTSAALPFGLVAILALRLLLGWKLAMSPA